MKAPVAICYTINNSYAAYCACSISSIIQHASPKRDYLIFIFSNDLSETNKTKLLKLSTKNCSILFHEVKNNPSLNKIANCCQKHTKKDDFFYKPIYWHRYAIPDILTNYDKCIYLDSDTIILNDIGKLIDTNLRNKVVAASKDPVITKGRIGKQYASNVLGIPQKHFVNSGVLVMNLKLFRKIKYLQMAASIMHDYDPDLTGVDQEYMNVLLYRKIKFLPYVWNTSPTKTMSKNTKLIHYNLNNKPWNNKKAEQANYFWQAAQKTDFFEELQQQLSQTEAKPSSDVGKLIWSKLARLTNATKTPLRTLLKNSRRIT